MRLVPNLFTRIYTRRKETRHLNDRYFGLARTSRVWTRTSQGWGWSCACNKVLSLAASEICLREDCDTLQVFDKNFDFVGDFVSQCNHLPPNQPFDSLCPLPEYIIVVFLPFTFGGSKFPLKKMHHFQTPTVRSAFAIVASL